MEKGSAMCGAFRVRSSPPFSALLPGCPPRCGRETRALCAIYVPAQAQFSSLLCEMPLDFACASLYNTDNSHHTNAMSRKMGLIAAFQRTVGCCETAGVSGRNSPVSREPKGLSRVSASGTLPLQSRALTGAYERPALPAKRVVPRTMFVSPESSIGRDFLFILLIHKNSSNLCGLISAGLR